MLCVVVCDLETSSTRRSWPLLGLSATNKKCNQLDAQNLFHDKFLVHTSTCFEHMCSKHVEALTKPYCETNFVHRVG